MPSSFSLDPSSNKCVFFNNTVLFDKGDIKTEVNLVMGYIILVLGIIGNSLAIMVNKFMRIRFKHGNYPSGNSPYINNFILKWFYIFSLITVLTSIGSPLMKIHGDTICCRTFWNSKVWNVYLANVHYPVTKTLMSFSFFLYFVFFYVQMMAVKYPTRFKSLVTKRKVIWAMVVCFIYSLAWYAPTFKWYYTVEVLVCQNSPKLRLKEFDISSISVYYYKLYIPSGDKKMAGQAYEILRELCVNIIPFFALITIKWIVVRRRRISFSLSTTNSVTPSRLVDGTEFGKKICGSINTINTENKGTTKRIGEFSNNRSSKCRLRESEQHSKTLIIITVQFIVFLLPISIMEMLVSRLMIHFSTVSVSHLYTFLGTLEYMYYSLTFYINFGFNGIYRQSVINCFKIK
ncbi:unnamed protein product [Gordionus sp. m RMFG-2023]